MQIPNGCMLSVTSDNGISTKVKGQPTSRMIDAGDIELIVNGPISEIKALQSNSTNNKRATYEGMISAYLYQLIFTC